MLVTHLRDDLLFNTGQPTVFYIYHPLLNIFKVSSKQGEIHSNYKETTYGVLHGRLSPRVEDYQEATDSGDAYKFDHGVYSFQQALEKSPKFL